MDDLNLIATPILDYACPEIQQILARLDDAQLTPREFVQKAHQHLSDVMRPIYSVAETQSVAKTVQLNGGSCSQRMACLEALARAHGVKTRVRGLWLTKQFWKERLPLLQLIMPKTLMPWPQFWLEDGWVDFDELFDSIADLALRVTHPFTNAGASLFDAIQTQPVDLLGKSAKFSLARFVASDAGFFNTRDELLARLDDRTWLGTLIFNLTYGGKPVRRVNEMP